ncbi:MAG TPA: hypothetical protein EYN67_18235 [Flavobacteriales bacterium]|nr:hypothetical protein [Flavobacteriales bacterium]
MSKQLKEQDNRCTADPIYMVCYDKWLTCADDRGDKEIWLINDDEYTECDNESEVLTYLHEHHCDWINDIKIEKYEDDCLCDDYDSFDHYVESDDFELNLETEEYEWPGVFGIERIRMQKEMTVVNSHLTEEGAKQFIKRKHHDYSKLYIYAYSMYFCNQMKELRNWIMTLTD